MRANETRRPRGSSGNAPAALLLAVLWSAVCAAPAACQDAPLPPFDPQRNVTVSTRDMELAAFLELLSVSYKLNIVSPRDITGRVSVNFYDVPPLDALKSVLEANGFEYVLQTTEGRPIIKIQTIPKVEGAVHVTMKTFVLNYATSQDIVKAAQPLVSKNGTIAAATGRNAVVVQDVPESIARIEKLVETLDAAPRQVMIDAKIVKLTLNDEQQIGFNWSMFQNLSIADIVAEASFARTAERVITRITGMPDTDASEVVRTTGSNIDLRGGVLDENDAKITLDFFDTLKNVTTIARPSIRTIDNKPAHIISGEIVPIPLFDYSKDTGNVTLSGFQEEQIGTQLTVTPHINGDGYITLEINPKVESIKEFIIVDGVEQRPIKNTSQATTTIRIKDGDTAVIGGLVSAQTDTTTTGLPILKDLPGVGHVFRHTKTTVTNSELIIFITPRTVKDGQERITDAERLILRQVEDARMITTPDTAPVRIEDSRPLAGDALSPLKK